MILRYKKIILEVIQKQGKKKKTLQLPKYSTQGFNRGSNSTFFDRSYLSVLHILPSERNVVLSRRPVQVANNEKKVLTSMKSAVRAAACTGQYRENCRQQ